MAVPTRAPQVVTLHDVLPVSHPELYPAETIHRFRAELDGARRAEVVVTTCEATAEEIVRAVGIPRQRIVVAPPGPVTAAATGSAIQPDEPYLLAVGEVTPRKGLEVLASAAALLGARCPRVLIAGPDWWRSDEVREAIAEHDVHGRVQLPGAVDDATLASLYRGATLVCHPSRAGRDSGSHASRRWRPVRRSWPPISPPPRVCRRCGSPRRCGRFLRAGRGYRRAARRSGSARCPG